MLKIKDYSFGISAILILAAAVLYAFEPIKAPWLMAVGVLFFCVSVVLNPYPGKSIRGKRLSQFRVFAFFLMVLGTYLMFKLKNEWTLSMLCAAVFLLYSSVAIPKELKREREE